MSGPGPRARAGGARGRVRTGQVIGGTGGLLAELRTSPIPGPQAVRTVAFAGDKPVAAFGDCCCRRATSQLRRRS